MPEINEFTTQFSSLFQNILGEAPRVLGGILVLVLLAVALRFFRRKLIGFLTRKADDRLLVNFVNSVLHITHIIIVLLLLLYILGLGNVASTILGAAGISAFVIGFALKDIGENFLAGVIMAFDRPFRLGDTIKSGSVEGKIVEMNLRDTHVKTFDGKDVYIPNGQIIKTPLYNYTIDGYLRRDFTVGVAYDTDIAEARRIMEDTIATIPGILQAEKPPRTHVKNLGGSAIEIECHFWVDTFDTYSALELRSQAQSRVVEALTRQGVEIPYDIIVVKHDGEGEADKPMLV